MAAQHALAVDTVSVANNPFFNGSWMSTPGDWKDWHDELIENGRYYRHPHDDFQDAELSGQSFTQMYSGFTCWPAAEPARKQGVFWHDPLNYDKEYATPDYYMPLVRDDMDKAIAGACAYWDLKNLVLRK
jgi:hypothetical protein